MKKIEGDYQDVVLHELGQDVVEGDLFSFFTHELKTIRLNYNASWPNGEKLPEDWPGKSSIDRLVSMSSPLFIQAATICRLLGDRRHGDPNELLQDVLCYKKTNQETQLDATYLPVLSRLFTGLSARRRKQGLERFKLIVGSIIIAARPLSTTSLSKLLSLPRNIIDCQLSLLHSVLSVPQSAGAPVTIFHLSFRDFLVDAERHETDDFWIDETTVHAEMATGCINVMRSFLKEDICGLRSWRGEASNIDRGAIGSYMPVEVEYACLHWSFHVEEAKCTSLAYDVLAFLNDHFLHWAEALALMMRTVEAITAMQRLLGIFRPQENTRLSDFLVDAVQILKANQAILDKAPLQLYSSVLQFSPQNSVVRKQFIRVLPWWVTLRPRTESNWGPLKQVLECEARITCVAVSHDSSLVAAYSVNGFIHIWRIETGECVNKFELKDDEGVQYMAFSHNSEVLALGDSQTTGLRLWSTITNDCLRKLEPSPQQAFYTKIYKRVKPFKGCWFAFSDDAGLLAVCIFQIWDDRFIAVIQCYSDLGDLIWESTIMESNDEFGWEFEPILDVSVAFSGDLTMIAARMGWIVIVWRIDGYPSGKVFESPPSTNHLISIALSHDGALLFMTSTHDFSVWSTDNIDNSRPRFRDIVDYGWFSGSLTVSADSTFVACFGLDYVYLWHKDKGEGIQNVVRQRSDIAVLSHDSSIIISGSGDKCLCVWSKNTFEPNRRRLADDSYEVDTHPTPAHIMEQSPNSEQIALCHGSQIQLWASDTGQHIRTLQASQERLDQFAFSRNSDLLAARSLPSGDIWVWSTRTNFPIQVFKNWGALAGTMSFSIDSKLLTLVCDDGVAIYSVHTGRKVQSLIDAEGRDERGQHSSQHPRYCACFAMFSPDSTLMVAVFCYGKFCLWSLDTGIRIRTLPCYPFDEMTLMPVAFSHDSQLMACIVGEKRVQLSSIRTREDIGTFEISGGTGVKSVAFLSDSSLLAVITLAGTVNIWSFVGKCCILSTRSDMETRHLCFQPSTGRLFTDFGTLRLNKKKTAFFSEGWGFSRDRCWITCYGRPVMWLPLNYRPLFSFVRGSTLIYSTKLGRVVVLRLKPVMRPSTPVDLVSITNPGYDLGGTDC